MCKTLIGPEWIFFLDIKTSWLLFLPTGALMLPQAINPNIPLLLFDSHYHCCLAPCKSVLNYGPLTEPKIYK